MTVAASVSEELLDVGCKVLLLVDEAVICEKYITFIILDIIPMITYSSEL